MSAIVASAGIPMDCVVCRTIGNGSHTHTNAVGFKTAAGLVRTKRIMVAQQRRRYGRCVRAYMYIYVWFVRTAADAVRTATVLSLRRFARVSFTDDEHGAANRCS